MSSFINSSSIAVVAATATAVEKVVVHDDIDVVYSPPPVRNFYPFKNEEQMQIVLALYLIFVLIAGFLGMDALIRCVLRQAEKSAPTPEQILGQMAMEPTVNFTNEVRLALAGGNYDRHPECAICLSEFVEGDRIRILTICRHGFHVNCIERWLLNEPSCPTCRTRTNTSQAWQAWHIRQQQREQQQQQQQNDVDLEAAIPAETEMVVQQQEEEQHNDIDLEAAIPSETEMAVVRQEQQQQSKK